MNTIINFKEDIKLYTLITGVVFINEDPVLRLGKNNSKYMTGNFYYDGQFYEFKVWEERLYNVISENGKGLYYVQIEKSVYNNNHYYTIKNIVPFSGDDVKTSDFLPVIDPAYINKLKIDCYELARRLGVNDTTIRVTEMILNAPELEGRFWQEGAAVRHHDNICGGLAHHTLKMLKIALVLAEIYPEITKHLDLFFMGIMFHDIGKVFEYRDLSVAKYWYANHRVRGIEILTNYRDILIKTYGEAFYRQLQAIIQGHHGEFQDRPTTVATMIVHYIDTIESQITGMLKRLEEAEDNNIFIKDIGYLAGFDIENRLID